MGHKSSLNIKLNVKILAVGASTNDQRTGYVNGVVGEATVCASSVSKPPTFLAARPVVEQKSAVYRRGCLPAMGQGRAIS